ncbi:replication restart helicase PriA [Desulfotalea psychrophila]|uniref:replication restart helicase PriA n=1 Tax=Desulfotalea psychrophila TaxID=84980 RepID=UPI00059D6754|nr:primosomal protein N' [Desulfotalea psychrophila]
MEIKIDPEVEVALALPVNQILTYSLRGVDTGGRSDAHMLGMRVLVPLSGRQATAYIINILREKVACPEGREEKKYKIRSILRFLDKGALFHSNMLPFFKWISDYYHYPLGLVIKSALPGGLTQKTVSVIKRGEAPWDEKKLAGLIQEMPDWLQRVCQLGKLSFAESRSLLKESKNRTLLTKLEELGLVQIGQEQVGDSVREKNEICYHLLGLALDIDSLQAELSPETSQIEEFRQSLLSSITGKMLFSEAKTLYYLSYLAHKNNSTDVPRRDLLRLYPGAAKALVYLEERGLVERFQRRVFRNPFGDTLPFFPRIEELSPEQEEACSEIKKTIEGEIFAPFLLYGITGSGKTEVYLRSAEEAIARGRDVLVLVPEIALATQLEAYFVSRFGDLVVLQHSGLKASEKYDQWSLALSGRAKIVIGARSAIFAPLKNVGLILVDEEHDGGFKQDDSFRYNARDLAVLRAKYHSATVVLGSATPSVTSFYHAKSGKYRLLTMKNRIGSRTLPRVRVIDLNTRDKGKKKKGIFQPPLQTALKEVLAQGKQSILLMNRRGFSAIVLCRDCGEIVSCKRCNVSLTLHRHSKKLVCHYCGFSLPEATVCRSCGGANIVPVGFGTERVEEEVQKLLPEARVARLDSDTAGNREHFLKILQKMRDGQIDVLIGTQMIAKGHHFPGVVLVGVVWADGGMSLPDFRAAEKTYQLISQVTGRAGRGDSPGKVFIQTMRPDHYAIAFARNHDYQAFYEHEISLRQNPLFPPFVRLIAFHIRGENEGQVKNSAGNIANFCRRENRDKKLQVDILGPAPAPIDRIKDSYRWQVLIKGSCYEKLHTLCHRVESAGKELLLAKITMIIDVDPENLM